MLTYDAPLADFRFLLRDVFGYESTVATLPGLEDATLDVVMAVLEGADTFARDVLLPIASAADAEGCRLDAGAARTPAGFREAYAVYRSGGWPAMAGDPAYGGQGLPGSLALFAREIVAAGSMAFGMYGGLSQGAVRALAAHGSDGLKHAFLPRLVDGSWTGTMCMTEPEAGSDLSGVRTRARPVADGSYRVTGAKIFISGGDHDLTQNIVHLVLARLPDAPAGTRGLSLLVVPKYRVALDGAAIEAKTPNGVTCTALEHKMGIRASATAALAFEDAEGWLVGEPNGGLRAMFTMMNSSRVGVAVQSVGVAELSFQNARRYAQERRQGRAPATPSTAAGTGGGDFIVQHPDVRKGLLTMKALVEGARALYVESAIGLDVRARHPDAAVRTAADSRLALLTPVLKGFISDAAVEVTRLGMSTFGGHGYIQDNGMEQLLRDASIVPLYEGTNAIQALDLVHRKLADDQGRTVATFLDETGSHIGAAADAGAPLDQLAVPLAIALKQLRDATALMQDRAATDPVGAAASASDYLRLFGWVALGAAWLRMAARAHALADRGDERPTFYSGKLKTARFVMTQLLPVCEALHRTLRAGAAVVADVAVEEL